MRDGACQPAHGGEFFALDESVLGPSLMRDLLDDGGDSFYLAIASKDRRVVDVPEPMFAGPGRQLALDDMISNRLSGGNLSEEFFDTFDGSDLGDAAAEDFFDRQADGFSLSIIDTQIAELDRIEEGQADGRGAVDCFEFCALALGFHLPLLQRVRSVFAIGDVDTKPAKPGCGTVESQCLTAALDPEQRAVGRTDGEVGDNHIAGFAGLAEHVIDKRKMGPRNMAAEGMQVRKIGEGMAEDGIGADSIVDLSSGEIDVPGGDPRGLLHNSEQVPLLLQGKLVLSARGDVAKEDDDAFRGGPDLDPEPEIERFGVEVLEVASDAVIHGLPEVAFVLTVVPDEGKLLPDVFSKQVSLCGQQFVGTAIEEGEDAFAADRDDGIAGGFENLQELPGG